jgi:hypothetical protein
MRYINKNHKFLKAVSNPALAIKWLFFNKIYLSNILYYYKLLFQKNKTFIFNEVEYNYYIAKHNYTYYNERCIELPIIFNLIENEKQNILEIGNVTSHYKIPNHIIVDKYEKNKFVINEDILTFNPKNKFDLICSISTIEHIGWDDYPKDDSKVSKCISRVNEFLNEGGQFIATAPMGYNTNLDNLILNKSLGFSEYYFMKRITKSGKWIQIYEGDIINPQYNYPFSSANILFIGVTKK